MTETVEKPYDGIYISGHYLWLIGVDTPNGIHCCHAGCSSGRIDLTCECPENEEIRRRAKQRIEELDIKPSEESILWFWLWNFEHSPMENRELFNTVLKQGGKMERRPPFLFQ
jgi:hypothetical protein